MVPKSGSHTGVPKKPSSSSRMRASREVHGAEERPAHRRAEEAVQQVPHAGVQGLCQREDLLFRGGFLQGGDLLLQGVEPGEELRKPLEEACVGGVEADGDAAVEGVFLKAVGELKLFHGRYLQNY